MLPTEFGLTTIYLISHAWGKIKGILILLVTYLEAADCACAALLQVQPVQLRRNITCHWKLCKPAPLIVLTVKSSRGTVKFAPYLGGCVCVHGQHC